MTEAEAVSGLIDALTSAGIFTGGGPGAARARPCSHPGDVDVRLVTGQLAASWCPACGRTAYSEAWLQRGE